MLLVVLPGDVVSEPFLLNHSEALLLVVQEVALVVGCHREFFAEAVLLVLPPVARVLVADSPVLVDSPPVPAVVLPLPIVDVPVLVVPHSQQHSIPARHEPTVVGPILKVLEFIGQSFELEGILVEVVDCLNHDVLETSFSLVDSHVLLLDSLLLFLDVSEDDVLLLEEVDLVELDVLALFGVLKVSIKLLPFLLDCGVVEKLVHGVHEHIMPGLLVEDVPDSRLYFLHVEALLEFGLQHPHVLLLGRFTLIELLDLLQVLLLGLLQALDGGQHHVAEGGLDVPDQPVHVGLVLLDELVHFAVLGFERPVAELVDAASLDFVDG